MITEPEMKPLTPFMNHDTGLEAKNNVFISVPYIPGFSEEFRRPYVTGFSEEFRRILLHTSVWVIFKWVNTLKSILMHPKDTVPSQLKHKHSLQMVLPIWKLQPFLHRGNQQNLENRMKELYNHVTSAVYIHIISKIIQKPTSSTSS